MTVPLYYIQAYKRGDGGKERLLLPAVTVSPVWQGGKTGKKRYTIVSPDKVGGKKWKDARPLSRPDNDFALFVNF